MKTNKENDTTQTKSLDEAIELVKTTSKTKFNGSVDLDIVLNLRDKQKKEVVRGSVSIPNSMGEEKKIVVLCEEKDTPKALKAGAVKAGLDEVIDELMKGFSDFDIVVATPGVMPKIVKLGKVLGPKGLMPNPRNGTITDDLEGAVNSFKSGRINYKTAQDQGVIRLKVAKVDMPSEQIRENVLAVLRSVMVETKKLTSSPLKKVVISPTMGAGVKVNVSDIIQQL